MRRLLVTSEEAVETPSQHDKPCSDCPFARRSLPGWLGPHTAAEWVAIAHGEGRIDCHALLPHECAGAAIYRANVAKLPRDGSLLRLPRNRVTAFSNPAEFIEHHKRTLE